MWRQYGLLAAAARSQAEVAHPHTELGLPGMQHIHPRCGCRAFFLEGLAPGLVGERVHTCPSRVKITYRSRKILAVATRARVIRVRAWAMQRASRCDRAMTGD